MGTIDNGPGIKGNIGVMACKLQKTANCDTNKNERIVLIWKNFAFVILIEFELGKNSEKIISNVTIITELLTVAVSLLYWTILMIWKKCSPIYM